MTRLRFSDFQRLHLTLTRCVSKFGLMICAVSRTQAVDKERSCMRSPKKSPLTGTVVILTLLLPCPSRAQLGFGQVWEKDAGNPLFNVIGELGTWNGVTPLSPLLFGHMIKDPSDQTYKLWLAGTPNGTQYSIGLWTSADGLAWTEHPGNPVMTGSGDGWDASAVGNAMVVYDDSVYRMWYAGHDGSGVMSIGYATSTDGIEWTKFTGNPVLVPGGTGDWDEARIHGPYVVNLESEFRMWYTGTRPDDVSQIGYATSPDGITWSKYESNPVLSVGAVGSWDQGVVAVPSVLVEDGGFMLWYEGAQSANVLVGLPQTGYARSIDGVTWTKDANNPVLAVGGPTSWDMNVAIVTQVLNDGGTYKMWYGGTNFITAFGAGLATLTAVTTVERPESIPSAFRLEQNFPNPFNPGTGIGYSLPTESFVTLKVFNVLGHGVRTLVHDDRDAGRYSVLWDGTNDLNRPVSSGVYFYRMTARSSSDGSHAFSRLLKMVLIR